MILLSHSCLAAIRQARHYVGIVTLPNFWKSSPPKTCNKQHMKFLNEEGGVDEEAWSERHDCHFFSYYGEQGGKSRSPRKRAAVKRNLIKANAARKAKAEERRRLRASQGQVPLENSRGFPPKD